MAIGSPRQAMGETGIWQTLTLILTLTLTLTLGGRERVMVSVIQKTLKRMEDTEAL